MPRTVDTRHVSPFVEGRLDQLRENIHDATEQRDVWILVALREGASATQIARAAGVSDTYIARLATRNGYTRTGGNTIHTRWVPPTTNNPMR